MERYDIVIIGSGPAGIQAGIHSARRGASVVLMGYPNRSALVKGHIENYACVDGVSKGDEMLRIGLEQVRRFGCELLQQDAIGISRSENGFVVRTEMRKELRAQSLILATGSARKKLGIPGEKEFEGKGVSYCADCDAGFFRKKKVVVAGNGSAAAHGALHLAHFASEVTLVSDKPEHSGVVLEELETASIKFISGRKVKEIAGEGVVKSALLSDGTTIVTDGVFIELGAKGVLELTVELGIELNAEGHVAVNRDMATNIEGVFAAGDVTGPPLQMAKAVGEGCVAGIKAAEFSAGGKKPPESGSY